MNKVGQVERKTQDRVVKLFQTALGYDYLGDWQDRVDNRNIEAGYLLAFLVRRGYAESLARRAIRELENKAGDRSRTIYDRNRDVYGLLRYGVQVSMGVGENYVTVWLIDWKEPENNHFALAEEVTVIPTDTGAGTKRPDIVLYVNGIALGVLELKRFHGFHFPRHPAKPGQPGTEVY